MSDTLRLFFALPVPPTQAREILSWRQQLLCSGNWVHGHDLHLTLAFLGQQPAARLVDLQVAAIQISRCGSFELHLDRLNIWSDGLLHLAPSCPPAHLLQLQQDLAEQLQQLGFALEQPTYRPHLTLARHASWPSTAPEFGFRWRVDRFALFTSKSVTIGPRYQQIGTWQLV